MHARPLAWSVAALVALAFGGCGHSGSSKRASASGSHAAAGSSPTGSSAAGEGARVSRTIRTALMSTDPAKCTQLATLRFLDQIELEKGAKAVRSCREDAKTDVPASSVAISRVKVAAGSATARAAVSGGDDDGSTDDLQLIERGGRWKLDHIAAVKLDFERYLRATRRELTRPPMPISSREAACTIRGLRRVGETAIERATVAADPGPELRPLIRCGRVRLRGVFEAGVRSALKRDGASSRSVACVIAGIRRRISPPQLDRLLEGLLEGSSPPPGVIDAIHASQRACGLGSGPTVPADPNATAL
jgi:hypothetical protein